ncbi:MAG TPA: hypothetical protein ENJ09_00595 [Planctomycetes bacterium]|nr:hypothetical protein [Planctomycetota bacterium]
MGRSSKEGDPVSEKEEGSAPEKGRGKKGEKGRRREEAASLPLDSSASGGEEAFDRRDVLAALEAGLAEALPGALVLDRDLAFEHRGRQGRADLLAVDPLGRLVLVLVADGGADRAVLDSLDLLAYARESAVLLVRHIASRRVDPGLAPRVVVVDPVCDEVLATRLGSLGEAGIRVFGIRTIKSAAGERSYLMPSGPEAAPPRSGEGGVRDFLEALPIALREVGRELTDRMARLDEELFATADRSTLVWRFHGEVLARLECDGSRLTASVAPDHRPSALLASSDIDGVLEGALARVLESADPDELPDDRPVETGEPILTQAEIEAFQG